MSAVRSPLRRNRGLASGLWALFRSVPVLSWSVSDVGLGLAAAVGAAGWKASFALDSLLVLIGATAFQGILAHGVNDLEDWRSGTDPLSPGLLSGGSRVIPRSLMSERQVAWAAAGAAVLGLGCAAALHVRHGAVVWPVAAVGLWSAVAYTLPPLRLAYRPLVGELVAGWPAPVAIIVGTFTVLAGRPGPGVWAAGAVQATFSVAWVMQHHLPDVPADLRAGPPKLTTPAWVARRWGPRAARLVPAGYYAVAGVAAAFLGLLWHPAFLGSAALAVLCARQGFLTHTSSVADITSRQLRMIALTALNAAWLAAAFLFWRLAG